MFHKLVSQPGRLAIATIYIITPLKLGRLAWLLNKGDKDDRFHEQHISRMRE